MRPVIAHVPRRFTPVSWGGTESMVAKLASHCSPHGIEPAILTSMALDKTPDWNCDGIPVRRFPYFYPEWPLSQKHRDDYDYKGGNLISFKLATYLTKLPNLKLVHLHTANRLGAQCLNVAQQLKIPCVWSIHGGHFALPQAVRDDFRRHGSIKDALGLPWGRALSWWLGTRTLPTRVDAIVCLNNDEFQAAKSMLPNQRVRLIPNGIDLRTYSSADRARGRRRLGVDNSRKLLVNVSRLDSLKDQLTLVKAWRRLNRSDCDLALVGAETTTGYQARCIAEAQGCNGKLIITGNIAPTDIPDYYSAADLVVLSSQAEIFGLAVIEAWACQRAVIASLTQGPRWLLAEAHADTGFPPGDYLALSHLLSTLLDDPQRCQALAESGAALVRQRFTLDAMVNATLDVYRELGVMVTSP